MRGRPSFFLMVPARKPRIEWACQFVASIRSEIVAPCLRRSSATIFSPLVPAVGAPGEARCFGRGGVIDLTAFARAGAEAPDLAALAPATTDPLDLAAAFFFAAGRVPWHGGSKLWALRMTSILG